MVLTPAARLIATRVATIALASLPVALTTRASLEAGPGLSPWFTEVDGRLPVIHLFRLFGELGSLGPALLFAGVFAVLGNQLLTAGALSIFLRRATDPDRPRVLRAIGRDGTAHLGAFLRMLLLGLLVSAIGASVVGQGMEAIGHIGDRRAWTAATTVLWLPLISGVAVAIVIAATGAWLLAARAFTVADGRRRVRRSALLALRACWRRPIAWVARFVVTTIALSVGSCGILFAWGQTAPGDGALAGWIALWALVLFVQASLWVWLVRESARLVDDAGLADLRSVPDAPFGFVARLRRFRA